MKEKFAKLIDVKSIMTLLLTLVFCVLAILGHISAEQFMAVFTMIVGFYFGTQSQKKAGADPAKSDAGTLLPERGSIQTPQTVSEDMAYKIHPPDQADNDRE